MARVAEGLMQDDGSVSAIGGAQDRRDDSITWAAATRVEDGVAEVAAVAPDLDETAVSEQGVDESLQLDLAAQGLTETNGDSAAAPTDGQTVAPSSDRAVELESEHWRERAIVWRERAMAAELVAKMLQRNLDDLRANLEDLRLKVDAAVADTERAAAIASSETPWRRFVRDMYDKYLR